MPRRPCDWTLVFLLAAIVAACGGASNGSTQLGFGDRGLDRCSLISADEAAQWLDSSVSAGPSEGFDGEPDLVTCSYEAEENRNAVLVQIYDGASFFAEPGSSARDGETLDGLGEDAWTKPGTVRFLQNDWAVSVSRTFGAVPDEALLEMAEMISARLP